MSKESKKATDEKETELMVTESLATKYRPTTLDHLVGQEAVSTKMRGMVRSKKFPNVFLISGNSGCGKTTVSLMLNRYINCKTHNACGKCESCQRSKHPDFSVHNVGDTRGIDDIRSIIGTASYKPQFNKRVIMLDECFPPDAEVEISECVFITIEQICTDPSVTSVLSFDTETWQKEIQPIISKTPKVAKPSTMVKVHLEDGTNQECTDNHKWWSVSSNEMVEAKDLTRHIVRTSTDKMLLVVGVTRVANEECRVYDIGVEKNHNFFVRPKGSQFSILVSNCHALTPQASTALLIPLENPSPNTIWILATTNPEKLLPTIVGRCHRFDLKTIEIKDMVKRLYQVAKQEGVDFAEIDNGKESLELLASLANGQMRDSLQLLESVIFALRSGEKIDPAKMISKYTSTFSVDLDKLAAKLLYAILNFDLKTVIKYTVDCSDARALVSKLRWLIHSMLQEYVGKLQFKTYSLRYFEALLEKDRVKIKWSLLLILQDTLTKAEITFNSSPIDAKVVLMSALGSYIRECYNQ